MRSLSLVALSLLGLGALPTAALADGALVEHPLGSTTAPYGFVEALPPTYATSPDAKVPMVVFLHGLGEEGNGTTQLFAAVTNHGPAKLIKNGSTYFADHGMLVIAPQSADWWSTAKLHTFLQYLVATYRVDPRRIYVTGLSMGGGGTWDYARDHGDKLAAIMPIAGASGPSDATKLVGLPVWAFHDWDDGTVTRQSSIGWANHIASAILGGGASDVLGGYPHANGDSGLAASNTMTAAFDGTAWTWVNDVVAPTHGLALTLYPTGGHDAWTKTYDNDASWNWLVAQSRPAPAELASNAIIIDNLDAGASFTGAWARAEDEPGYYGWDEHRATAGDGISATFATTLAAGKYDVKLRFTSEADHASIPVEIVHAGGSTLVNVDMKSGGGAFVSLGMFDFDGEAKVILHAESATGVVVGDAVAFEIQAPDPSTSATGSGGPGATGSGAGGASAAGAGGGASTGSGSGDNGMVGTCAIRAPENGGSWKTLALLIGLSASFARRRRARLAR